MKKLILTSFFMTVLVIGVFAQSLGNGYQNAKWGMTPAQVKQALVSSRIKVGTEGKTSDGETAIRFIIDNQKEITCFFYKNRFYYAEYNPKLKYREEDIAATILSEMKSKYGNGKTYRAEGTIIYFVVTEWNDSETKIVYQIDDKQMMGYDVSGSLVITYTSIEISTEKNTAERNRANAEREQRRGSFSGDL